MSDTTPTFSIITPSFKMLEWLKLCSASVSDQERVTLEHIVRDGGTGPALDEWASAHPEVRCIQEPDRGMYDAINKGLKNSRGRLLAYLNCDEQYLSGALAKVERFFAENLSVEVVFGDTILVDLNGQPLSYRRAVTPDRTHLRLDHLNTLTCATFFRRSVIERGLLFDTQLGSIGDAVWMNSLLEAGVPMACLPQPLAIYTFTGMNDSETSSRPAREVAEWQQRSPPPRRWLRLPAILLHRIRKLAAGAYQRRSVDYEIYTKASPHRRVRFQASKIHYGWPGTTAPAATGCESYRGANRTTVTTTRP